MATGNKCSQLHTNSPHHHGSALHSPRDTLNDAGSPSTHTWFLTADVCPQQNLREAAHGGLGAPEFSGPISCLGTPRTGRERCCQQTPPSHKGVHPGDVCSVSWTHQDPAVGAVTTAENNFKNKETYTTGVPIVVHATVKMVLKFVSF